MSNPIDEQEDDRPTVVGTDPDMNIGDDDPAAAEHADEASDEEDDADPDDIEIADLP